MQDIKIFKYAFKIFMYAWDWVNQFRSLHVEILDKRRN